MNTLLPSFKELILTLLLTTEVRVLLVDTQGYSFSPAHTTLSSVPQAARIATSLALTGKMVTGGVFVADPVVFPSAAGPPVGGTYLYLAAETDAGSRLVLWTDTADPASQAQFPFSPASGNLTLQWTGGEVFAL